MFKNSLFKQLKKSAALLWEASPPTALILVTMAVVQGILPLLLIYCIKLLIDMVLGIAANPGLSIFNTGFLSLLAITSAVFFLNQVFMGFIQWLSESFVVKITGRLFENIHQKSILQEYANFENPYTQDMAFRARNELAFRPERLLKNFLNLVQSFVSFALAVGMIVYLNPLIGLFLLALVVPGLLFRIKFARLQYENKRRRTPLERMVMYFSRVLTDSVFAKEIRLFSLGRHFSEKFGRQYDQLGKLNLTEVRQRTIADLASQAIATVLMAGAILWVAYMAVAGSISSGDLVMYILVFQRSMTFLRGILSSITGIYEDVLGLSNYFEFMELPLSPPAGDLQNAMPDLKHGIEFQAVSFHYPGHTKEILKNVSLHFPAGKITLLAGPNGSGKSTLVKLLSRLYAPTSGRIMADGMDLELIPREKYLEQVSALFQDFVLYHQTAAENIGFGDVGKTTTPDNLTEAAEKAGINVVLQGLPQKLDTRLGYLFENSAELSMGQWQRLALARAFYKDSRIVLLDEPSSALDAIAENDFYQRIHRLMKGKTAIIVSHRLSFAHLVDQVVLLSETGPPEIGTHEELMKKNGEYASMYSKQAAMYSDNRDGGAISGENSE